MIVLHPIHQTIIIITECHAIASRYDFLTLDGVSLHPSFRFDIAAIHGRNGELHASVGVGRVLATLELVWYDDTMYVQCDRRLDRLLGNDQKCFGSFRGGSMVGILVLGIQVPGSGNTKHQTVDRHPMSRSSLDPRGFRFVGTGRLLSILSAPSLFDLAKQKVLVSVAAGMLVCWGAFLLLRACLEARSLKSRETMAQRIKTRNLNTPACGKKKGPISCAYAATSGLVTPHSESMRVLSSLRDWQRKKKDSLCSFARFPMAHHGDGAKVVWLCMMVSDLALRSAR